MSTGIEKGLTQLSGQAGAHNLAKLNSLIAGASASLADERTAKARAALAELDTYDPETMSDGDEAELVDRGTMLRDNRDRLRESMRSVTSWFDGWAYAVRQGFKVVDDLTLGTDRCKKIILAYRDVKRLRAERSEREARQAAEIAAAKAGKHMEAAPPPADTDIEERMPANVTRGNDASAIKRMKIHFEVVDVALAAKHYPHLFTLDQTAAKLELKAARARDPKATLHGIRYTETEDLSFQRRR